jgi:hypothetical protein
VGTNNGRAVQSRDDALSYSWTYCGSRKRGPETVSSCSLGTQAALTLFRREARRAGLRTNGFRSAATTPPRLLYASHKNFFERVLIFELQRARLEPLVRLVDKAPLPPEYRVLDWSGGPFVIEVTCLSIPGVPDPGARFGGAARGSSDPALILPSPTAPQSPQQPPKERRVGAFAGPGLALEGGASLAGLADELTGALPAQQARRASLLGPGRQPNRSRPEPQAPETQLQQGGAVRQVETTQNNERSEVAKDA